MCEHYGRLSHDGHEVHITCSVIYKNYNLQSEGILRHHHNIYQEELKKKHTKRVTTV